MAFYHITLLALTWVVFGLLALALAKLLNKLILNKEPASPRIALSISLLMFLVAAIWLSIVKAFRYRLISELLGYTVLPDSPFDMAGAFIFAWIFYWSLCRKKREHVNSIEDKPSEEGKRLRNLIVASGWHLGRLTLETKIFIFSSPLRFMLSVLFITQYTLLVWAAAYQINDDIIPPYITVPFLGRASEWGSVEIVLGLLLMSIIWIGVVKIAAKNRGPNTG